MATPFVRWTLVAVGCSSLVVVAACSSYDATEDVARGTSAAALSFASGNSDGYCASNPSAQCWEGKPLATKQLALTFDDGPGSQTLALSSYLKSRGIRATFFVNGHCFGQSVYQSGQCQQDASASPSDILGRLVADGHLVGNHTQDHFDLTSLDDNSIVRELADTDAIISPFVDRGHLVFRAPFGAWSSHDYDVLHASAMDRYVGPVKWDIGGAMTGSYGADWDCWQNTNGYGVMTTQQCGDRYMREIVDVGRGIILMHDADYGDPSNHDVRSGKGNTIDMVKYLIDGDEALGVSGLAARGYTFVRLDEVPDIASSFGGGGGGGGGGGADAGTTDSGGGSTDAGSTDSGSGTCGFDPAWQQTTYANEWWVEYTISGSIASASLEVIGGATFALSSSYGKWVGSPPSQIRSGTKVVVHAKDSAGKSAQTQPFSYLVTTKPVTACGTQTCTPSCGSHNCGDDGCGGSCGACASGQTCNAGTCASSGGTCSGTFHPTWAEGSGANNWWVEYVIGGQVASAYLEVVGGSKVTLSLQWGEWVGPTNTQIDTGTSVIVHAQSTSGELAQTAPFGYLTTKSPATAACK
jgi:peptidoglycan/xylan/chitin deacetylase (PgdA/CDA1 family)